MSDYRRWNQQKLEAGVKQCLLGFNSWPGVNIVLTTHTTLSSNNFIGIIKSQSEDHSRISIVDEVHGIGSNRPENRTTGRV